MHRSKRLAIFLPIKHTVTFFLAFCLQLGYIIPYFLPPRYWTGVRSWVSGTIEPLVTEACERCDDKYEHLCHQLSDHRAPAFNYKAPVFSSVQQLVMMALWDILGWAQSGSHFSNLAMHMSPPDRTLVHSAQCTVHCTVQCICHALIILQCIVHRDSAQCIYVYMSPPDRTAVH